MAANRLLTFQSGTPVFLPHLLEVGLYHGAALPEEKEAAWHLGRPKADYFLFHCIAGVLNITCRQKAYSLQAGGVLLLDGKQAVSVEAQADTRAAAFRFRCEKGKPPLRAGRVYQAAHGPVQEAFYAALSAVDEPTELLVCNRLSLQFALLLYEWRGAAEKGERKASISAYEAEIREAVSYMRAHLDEKIQMSELAKGLHLSERNFRKCFTASLGVSPKAYLQKARLEHAKELLRAGEQSISEISEAVGYYSQFQFSRDFKKEYGLTPSDYRGGAEVSHAKKAGNSKKK